jgi:dihydroxyacetone kinase-like predicted kinase
MNPSTDDILSAIEATPAKTVFVLPNNKNIILAAEQAVPLADRNVVVLPTRTIPQGIAAMLAFNPDEDADTNAIAMQKAADNVSTGSVTFAARDSDFEGHKIQEGQILALDNGKLSFVDTDVAVAAPRLARRLVRGRLASDKEVSFITVIYGDGVSEQEAEDVCENIRNKMARMGVEVDVSAIPGGQPVYYYFISVE